VLGRIICSLICSRPRSCRRGNPSHGNVSDQITVIPTSLLDINVIALFLAIPASPVYLCTKVPR